MTTMTRDTCTDAPAGLFEPDHDDGHDQDDAAAILTDHHFDPTRVRLTGLRAAEWATESRCAAYGVTYGNDPWHPGTEGQAVLTFPIRAREMCGTCPVRVQCLALGLALLPLGDVHGMYGGYTPTELRKIADERGMASRTVAQHGTRARRVAGCDCAPCKRAHAVYVAELRAQERFAESDKFEAEVAAALPIAEATVTPLNLLDLLAEVS